MAETRDPVIDVDFHLAERPADLAPFCDAPWRVAVEAADGLPPWTVRTATHPTYAKRVAPPPAHTPAALRERMATLGTDAALLLPGPLLKLGILPTPEYATALAAAYNRWLAATWLADADAGNTGGVYGAVLVAPQEPEAAAREIAAYAGQPGVRAVLLPMAGTQPLLGDRRYDPLYAAAQEADLPVILHGGADLQLPSSPVQPTQFASAFDRAALSQPFVAAAHLVSIVGAGALARFPGLRLVFLEAGMVWLAHLSLRMDKEYNENHRDIPFYTDRVSGYLARQVWVGTHPREVAAAEDLDALARVGVGAGHLVYGSHYPYADHDPPARVLPTLTEATRRGVMGANAAALFGLSVPATAAAAAGASAAG